MKNFQKMNKYSLFLDVIRLCRSEGLIYIDVDKKKCYLDNDNNYYIISKNDQLLTSLDLDKLFKTKDKAPKVGKVKTFISLSLIPFILLSFLAMYVFLQIFVYGFLGLIRNQEKRYLCSQNQEYKELKSEQEIKNYIQKCMSN